MKKIGIIRCMQTEDICPGKGNPIGFPCPHHETMIAAIRAKLGDSVPVLDHTH